MRITFEINPGKDIDATDLTQLLQWAQRCDTGVAVLGEAIGSLQPSQVSGPFTLSAPPVSGVVGHPAAVEQIMQQISSPIVATLDPAAVERVMEVWPTLPKGGQIEVLPVTTPETPAPTTPEPEAPAQPAKKRGRRSAAEIEAAAQQYAAALKTQEQPPAPFALQTTENPIPGASEPVGLAWAPGVAVPPGMGVETPNFTAVPQTATAHVQPQAPAMPVVPPGPPINGVGGELTVDEMRSACSQMNNVKQGMPYRVLKNFGFFTIEAVPADQRANLVAAMQNELSAVA